MSAGGGGGEEQRVWPPRAKLLKDPNIRTNTRLLSGFGSSCSSLFIPSALSAGSPTPPFAHAHRKKKVELHADLRGKATDYRTLSLLLVKLSDLLQRKKTKRNQSGQETTHHCANTLTEQTFFCFPSHQQRSSLVFYSLSQEKDGCRQTRERCLHTGEASKQRVTCPDSWYFTSQAGRLIK